MMIAIAGGSGFIGTVLQEEILKAGHQVTILTRHPEKIKSQKGVKPVEWLTKNSAPEKELEEADAIVNLAGESINGRWTQQKKERILKSRIKATNELISIIKKVKKKPRVFVNGSAVGYYGMSESETFTEGSKSHGSDFLAAVASKWEQEASKVEDLGIRTVYTRFGVVLGDEGALPLMALPYKWGVGGTIGSGRQWVSWVHVKDTAGLILHAIQKEEIRGPLNVTAPHPLRMAEFGKTLGSVIHRPHWLTIPSFVLKAGLGEMSDMLLGGQKVIPKKAEKSGYLFKYPQLEAALWDLLNKPKRS